MFLNLTLECPTAFSLSRNNSKLASNKILHFRKHSLPSILINQAFLKSYNPNAPIRFQSIQSLFYHRQIAPFHRNSAAGSQLSCRIAFRASSKETRVANLIPSPPSHENNKAVRELFPLHQSPTTTSRGRSTYIARGRSRRTTWAGSF